MNNLDNVLDQMVQTILDRAKYNQILSPSAFTVVSYMGIQELYNESLNIAIYEELETRLSQQSTVQSVIADTDGFEIELNLVENGGSL